MVLLLYFTWIGKGESWRRERGEGKSESERENEYKKDKIVTENIITPHERGLAHSFSSFVILLVYPSCHCISRFHLIYDNRFEKNKDKSPGEAIMFPSEPADTLVGAGWCFYRSKYETGLYTTASEHTCIHTLCVCVCMHTYKCVCVHAYI